jgi:hypothetical protein
MDTKINSVEFRTPEWSSELDKIGWHSVRNWFQTFRLCSVLIFEWAHDNWPSRPSDRGVRYWGHGTTFVRHVQCKQIGSWHMELHNVIGSQVGRCKLSDTTIMILWLVSVASILFIPSSHLQHLLDWLRPQKSKRKRQFFICNQTKTEPRLVKSNHHNTTILSVCQ